MATPPKPPKDPKAPAKPAARRAPRKAPAKAAPAPTPRRAPAPPPAPAPERKPAVSSAAAWSLGAVVLAAGAGLAAFLTRGRIAAALSREGHAASDLPEVADDAPLSKPADDRAPVEFRPDMDAPMSAAEREALRPPPGPGPSLTSVAGTMNAQTGASN